MTVTVKSLTLQFMGEQPQFQMYVLLAAVIGVLIIACINVANLLLVRAVQRVRELAVRAALGAGRGILFGQLLLEAAILASIGGALGIGVAFAGVRGLSAIIGPDRLPFWADLRLDGQTLLFVLALTVVAALVAGALPAIRATKASVTDVLKDESRGASSLRVGRIMQGMVVLQIAISLALVINTGLMLVGLRNVQRVGLGFATDDVVTAQVTFPDGYDDDARLRFFTDVEQRISTESGVTATTIASALPTMRAGRVRFALEGQSYAEDNSLPATRRVFASDDFFETYDVDVIRGRGFAAEAPDGEPVVIVNQRFAVRFFPGGDALGQRIRLGNLDSTDPWRTIVGIVPDLWTGGLDASDERNPPGVYVPLTQVVPSAASIAVRAGASPAQTAAVIRNAVAAADPDVPVFDVRSMPDVIVDNSWFYGMGAAIVGVCGFAALLLAIIGLYGVVAFAVGRRIREFGIRMAVGASPLKILALVLRRAGLQIGVGVLVGVVLASVISRGVALLMFDVDPVDVFIFSVVSAILILVNIAATAIPAQRAARTDPLVALRAE
jgi:predicted permease